MGLVGALLVGLFYFGPPAVAEKAVAIPPVSSEILSGASPKSNGLETAVFAGGCFWGIQAVFQHTLGVTNAVSGYAGGKGEDADYQRVSGGGTGHAESVQVSYDPKKVSYGQLLQIFLLLSGGKVPPELRHAASGLILHCAV